MGDDIFYEVATLSVPGFAPFAVVRIDLNKPAGDGVEATVMSLHWAKADAEAAARDHREAGHG